MQEYKDELISKAEILITRGFPEKIVELNELLTTKMFADRNFHDVFQVKTNKSVHLSNQLIEYLLFSQTGSQHSSARSCTINQ